MFDTERFICEIEGQPPLYDIKSKEYSNRDVKAKCWVKVAEVMFEDWTDFDMKTKDEKVKELMKKWKAIRDCFVRDHRSTTAAGTGQAASKKKKYIFYDQLLFLLPHVKGNSNTGSNIASLHSHEHVGEESQMEDIDRPGYDVKLPIPT
ncbi:hypothetical protein J6590_084978 [Homalodisca vitripennis]|nr:hypothetical protein J6590_084978 [Homalodisca vitripennis]